MCVTGMGIGSIVLNTGCVTGVGIERFVLNIGCVCYRCGDKEICVKYTVNVLQV